MQQKERDLIHLPLDLVTLGKNTKRLQSVFNRHPTLITIVIILRKLHRKHPLPP